MIRKLRVLAMTLMRWSVVDGSFRTFYGAVCGGVIDEDALPAVGGAEAFEGFDGSLVKGSDIVFFVEAWGDDADEFRCHGA